MRMARVYARRSRMAARKSAMILALGFTPWCVSYFFWKTNSPSFALTLILSPGLNLPSSRRRESNQLDVGSIRHLTLTLSPLEAEREQLSRGPYISRLKFLSARRSRWTKPVAPAKTTAVPGNQAAK
jgi:hypothetical protein